MANAEVEGGIAGREGMGKEANRMNDGHVEAHATKLKAELTSFFGGLVPAVDIVRRAQKEMDRRAATKFSIFDYLCVRETDLSRIFADLLDPSGSHGQGDRFLSLFLKETLPEYSLPRTLTKGEKVATATLARNTLGKGLMPTASAAVVTSACPAAHRRSRAHRRYFPSPDR